MTKDKTKIISNEEYWKLLKEDRDKFHGFCIDKVSVRYVQAIHDDYEDLIIETDDEGGGRYIVLKTEKFSLNDLKELEDIVKDFFKRANLKKEKVGKNNYFINEPLFLLFKNFDLTSEIYLFLRKHVEKIKNFRHIFLTCRKNRKFSTGFFIISKKQKNLTYILKCRKRLLIFNIKR